MLQTKLYPPRWREGLVPRPELVARLERGASGRLTLVSAPAGSGKTTLLGEWLAEHPSSSKTPAGREIAWLSLDAADSDLDRFWTYVVAALQAVRPELGEAARAMLESVTVLLACQLAGEALVRTTGLPVPGPVVGMLLLFAGLAARGGVPEGLERASRGLLDNLSLLFVPAGVGVLSHLALVGAEWLPISVSLLVSTVLTIAVTGLVAAWLRPRDPEDEGR